MNAIVAFFVWLWSCLTYLARKFLESAWPRAETIYRAVRVEDLPDNPAPGSVYLAGEGHGLWAASMQCPCGCKDVIELNLLTKARPCWAADEHADGTVTLRPSVWRQKGCRSHFVLRKGRIVWC